MRRRIGFLEAFSIGVGGMIGGGIFAVLGLTIEYAGGAAPLAFVAAGLVALATAYSYARLSVRFPSEGGTVEFLVRAFGPGLLSGWLNILLLASYVVMLTLYSYAFGSYASSLLLGGENWFTRTGFAWMVLGVFTLLNALGAYVVGRVEDALVVFKVAVLLLFSGVGLVVGNPERLEPTHWPSILDVLVGGFMIFLAYEGFELIANAAKDVVYPERTIPRALYASVATVMLIYVLTSAAAVENLTPRQVIEYRDYALAVAARPALGDAGFMLVSVAALASTASAINATLYGAVRISYVVAKYGQLPMALERRVWRGATEGLIAISLLAAAAVALLPLEAISLAGSLGFLTVFAAVNIAAYRLRRLAKANPMLTLVAASSCIASACILVAANAARVEALVGAILVFTCSLLLEALVKTGRRIREYIDEELRVREQLVASWESWLPRVIEALKRLHPESRVYLIGGIARGEHEKSHDVDLLVAARGAPRGRRALEEQETVARMAGLPERHPLHIHYVEAGVEEERVLKRVGAYKRVA